MTRQDWPHDDEPADASPGREAQLVIPPVVCVGEALVLLSPVDDVERDVPMFTSALGGAEANVAHALAQLGVPVQWLGHLGEDPLGRIVRRLLVSAGVGLEHVTMDPHRPTGLCTFAARMGGRARCATTAQGPQPSRWAGRPFCLPARTNPGDPCVRDHRGAVPDVPRPCGGHRGVPSPFGQIISFDVNWRPALWDDDGPQVLQDLASSADVVPVGADEAEATWGTGEPHQIAELLNHPPLLVVKHGETGATAVRGAEQLIVPAQPVQVVDATGAGDAFPAGLLAGQLHGLELEPARRLAHLVATKVLCQPGDVAQLPELAALLGELDALPPAPTAGRPEVRS